MKTFYIKTFVLLVLIILSIRLIDSFLVQDELFHTTHKRAFSGEEKFDFLVMGNSLSQRSFNMTYVDSVFNTSSLNIGSSAQHFYTTGLLFNDLISNNELYPTKLLIITISPWQLEILDDETWKFLQMAPLDNVSISKEYFEVLDEFYTIYEYPKVFSTTIRFHNEIADNLIESDERLSGFKKNSTTGFVLNIKGKLDQNQRNKKKDLNEVAAKYTDQIQAAEPKKISERAEQIIINMIDKCRENNVKILFVTPPAIKTLYKTDDFGTFKYFEDLFKSKNIDYLNLNHKFNDMNLTFDDFNDLSHLNSFGNRKLAPYFLDYITNDMKISQNEISTVDEPIVEEPIVVEQKMEVKEEIQPIKSLLDLQNYKTELIITENSYENKKTYILSRTSSNESAFSSTRSLDIKSGDKYKTSVIVKKGKKGSLFGLRMQGKYPDRVDAVFDLETGILIEVKKSNKFSNESATIEDLGEGWYKCSVISNINSDAVKIILGPTTFEKPTVGWEGKTNDLTEVEIAIKSLTLNKVI